MELDLLGILWLAIPGFFVLWALYAKLEQKSKSVKKQDPGHYLRQGGFLAICVALTFAIDRFVLPSVIESFLPEFIPVTMLRILLLPAVLLLGAVAVGGSKMPQIQRRDKAGRIKKGKP